MRVTVARVLPWVGTLARLVLGGVLIAAGLLKVGGVLAIEHDGTQGDTVPDLLRLRRVLTDVTDHEDLTGRPRFVTATRIRLPARAANAPTPASDGPTEQVRR